MDKQKAQEKYDEVQAELAKLKAIIDAPDKAESWPQAGDRFYVLSADGCVSRETFEGCGFLLRKLAMGSVFRTKAEAEAERDKQLATVRVENTIKELQGDWKPDWDDHDQKRYYLAYSHESNKIIIREVCFIQTDTIYSTKEACWWVIDHMEDDVKLMLGVK